MFTSRKHLAQFFFFFVSLRFRISSLLLILLLLVVLFFSLFKSVPSTISSCSIGTFSFGVGCSISNCTRYFALDFALISVLGNLVDGCLLVLVARLVASDGLLYLPVSLHPPKRSLRRTYDLDEHLAARRSCHCHQNYP